MKYSVEKAGDYEPHYRRAYGPESFYSRGSGLVVSRRELLKLAIVGIASALPLLGTVGCGGGGGDGDGEETKNGKKKEGDGGGGGY